jgi:hypothetical protein
MIIYSEFPLLGKMFSCLRCRVVTTTHNYHPTPSLRTFDVPCMSNFLITILLGLLTCTSMYKVEVRIKVHRCPSWVTITFRYAIQSGAKKSEQMKESDMQPE